ncbi:uncharacterized protein LOC134206670 [Armigeres subalbatus]|uniref:uncharacterized protein LOC134206670 n=1 Tax=Armigeres subalbatus TaxID=124917 RepID=UPI002ED46A3A
MMKLAVAEVGEAGIAVTRMYRSGSKELMKLSPPATQAAVSLPAVCEPSVLETSVSQPAVLNFEQPRSNSIQQQHFRSMVSPPSQPPPVSQPSQEPSVHCLNEQQFRQHSSLMHTSFDHQPHTLVPGLVSRAPIEERPPSVLRETLSHTPPPQHFLPHESSLPYAPIHRHQQTEQYATQLQQLQNQQAMWGQFQQQLSARQVVPKDLPVFTGNPDEWPLFVSSFRNSTAMCGYSHSENLMRLQKCLKGRALEAVLSILLLPSSVPKIMETLETLFGSPERLVQSLLCKVRSVSAPKAERFETLVNFGIVVQNLVGHLKAANQQAHLTNPTLLHELVDKLPPHIRLDWAVYKKNVGVVDLGIFCDYMSAITAAASDIAHFSDFDDGRSGSNARPRKEKVFVNTHISSKPRKFEQHNIKMEKLERPCYICQSNRHRIKECYKFKSLSLGDHLKAVETHKLCAVCLVPHGKWSCKSTRICGIGDCAKKHHSSLHPSQQTVAMPATERTSSGSKAEAVVTIHRKLLSSTIFRIIPVILYGENVKISTYAFLDEGSSSTLIDKSVADQLNLVGDLQPLCLTWTSKVSRHEADSRLVNLRISGEEGSRIFPLTGASTVSQLNLPIQTLRYGELSCRYPYLAGIPVKSYEQAIPRILIGLDNIKLLLPLKIREGQHNGPVAAKSRLGWTIFGSIEGANRNSVSPIMHICKSVVETELHEMVKQYFAMENLGVSVVRGPEAEEDRRARSILERTTTKCADGHYESGLLWRYDVIELPSSYGMAERRLFCLERKLRNHPELRVSLERQIIEYQEKGYAHKATRRELEESDQHRTWYLPLGVVTNPRKPGKVRIIWDAAAKSKGVSLNDMLLKGTDFLTSLPAVLCRFRQRQVAIAGDIREMYHQVRIRKEDQQAQRFLYRNDPARKPDVFVMDVAIFGSTCSPCSANFVKNMNASMWKEELPEAAAAIVDNHYVDDYLDSRDTEEEMAKLALDVRKVQEQAGFQLRNWRSNSKVVLQSLGEGAEVTTKNFSIDKESQIERVLGMAWLPDEDVFVYTVSCQTIAKVQQRMSSIRRSEAF